MSHDASPMQAGTAGTSRIGKPISAFKFLRRIRDNGISIYPASAHEVDFVSRRLGLQQFILLNHPDYIQHVLVRNQENYPKGRLTRQILGPALGRGLLNSEGAFWRQQRRISAPSFHHKRLIDLAQMMSDTAIKTADKWQTAAQSGEPLDIARDMMRLTMEIVAKSLFSHDIAGSIDELGAAIRVMIDSIGRPSLLDLLGLPEWLPRPRSSEFTAAMALIDTTIYEILRQRRAATQATGENAGDLLGMLLAARDEETGEGMSDRQLRDEVVTIFAAGHETTAVAMSWTWYLLSQHPQCEARLHEELDQVLAGRAPCFADLEQLPYTRMVFEEAIRLYPPAFSLTRVAAADDSVGPHHIPKGAMVTLSPWVTHRNPRLWPDPERFDPERFLPEAVRQRHKFAYFPFGGGPRVCIGNSFALMEGRLILAALAQRYRLRLEPDHPVKPQGRITLRPRHGMRMTIEARSL